MTAHLDDLLDRTGEAAGVELAKACLQDNIDRLADSIYWLERERLAADPETAHLAALLDRDTDSELSESAHLVYESLYRHLHYRIERFAAHVGAQNGKSQRRYAAATIRNELTTLLREDIEDLEF